MNSSRRPHRLIATRRHRRGFTLIELMITVAILGILTAVALPMYRGYMVRGKLVAGTNALAAQRTAMEQYYQDNRTYVSTSTPSGTAITSPCASTVTADTFSVTCTSTATTYLITATGSGLTSNAVYTVDEKNNMVTLKLPTVLGSVPTNNKCWIMRKGDSC
jgi:type IV pilus assembly protein PilE